MSSLANCAETWTRRQRHVSVPLIRVLALTLVVAGCASTDRLPPVPLSMASKINIDIPDARFYPDTDGQRMSTLGLQAYKRAYTAHHGKLSTAYFLAISGGGDDGAFGTGAACGLDRSRRSSGV